jgi:hypothetical protein
MGAEMALIACPVPGKEKSKMLCEAFIAGAPKNATGFVFYGVKAGNHAQWMNARRSGMDWYFIDNSYFDLTRGTMYRVAKNRLQHDGEGDSDHKRAMGIEGFHILPFNSHREGYILIIPQSEDHMRYVLDEANPHKWLARMKTWAGKEGKVREWRADKPALMKTLQQDLAGARLLATHTSAAAVEAVLMGVPVVCERASAAWKFSRGNQGDPTSGDPASLSSRLRWAAVLADNQWTIGEMKEGVAWRSLNLK